MSTTSPCRDFDAVLSAYVDHEATAAEMATVEAHARTCRACAARLRRYQSLTPRLEADVRALLFKAEAAAPQRNTRHFRDQTERLSNDTAPLSLVSRLSTVALALGAAVVIALVLMRSAPVGPAPAVVTGAQPTPASQSSLEPWHAPLLVVTIDGLVDPAVAAYVHRAVAAAEDGQAAALVIVLNASGGLDGPMQQVAQDLANSSVPVLTFSPIPPGSDNAADTRLALSTDLVAPVASTLTLDSFLRAVDGREAHTPQGSVVLATAGARQSSFDMESLEAVAHRLMDPTTAYLLFVLGLYAAFIELAHPGALLPGATGVVCLTTASLAFAMLPTNWLGVVVLLAAVGLMAVELKAATHGVLVLAGVMCLILGSVLLYSAPGTLLPMQSDISIAPGVLIGAAVTGLVVGLLLARIARRIHNLPPVLNLEQLIGARGVSRGGLDPEGVVQVGGQLWSARVRGGRLEPGQPVRVVARHGLVLEVESAALGAATRKGTLS